MEKIPKTSCFRRFFSEFSRFWIKSYVIKLIRYHLPTIVKHVLAPKNDFGTKPLHVCWIQYSYNRHKRPFCELDFLKTGEYVDYHRCRTFSCSGFCACKQTLCDVNVGVPVTEAGAALGEIDVHATRHKPCFSPHCDASLLLLLLLPQLGSFVLYTSSFCFQPT